MLQVVVCTSQSYEEASRINAICHSAGTAFIKAETRGVFANVFCDFGDSFTVLDTDGARLFMSSLQRLRYI